MTAPQIAIVRALPIASIAAPSNIRLSNGHDKESLSNLADSIRAHGLLQPIVVRKADADDRAEYCIIAGRRRLAASKLAGLDSIPAIVSETDEAKAYELEIAENIQREQMTLADTARAVRTLMLIHDSAKKVGAIVNKSPAWVSKHLTITANAFPPELAELLNDGHVSDLEALLLLTQIGKRAKHDPNAAHKYQRLLTIASEGDLTRQLAKLTLQTLQAKDAPAEQQDVTGEDTEATQTTPTGRAETFGKLELAQDTAATILDALKYTKNHKPSSRPSEALISHVEDFIRKVWG